MLLSTILQRTTYASKRLGLWSRFKTIISPLPTRLCLKYRLLKVTHLERLETILANPVPQSKNSLFEVNTPDDGASL